MSDRPALSSPYMPRTSALVLQGVVLIVAGLAIVAAIGLDVLQLVRQARMPLMPDPRWWQWLLQAAILALGVFVAVMGISSLLQRSQVRRALPRADHHALARVAALTSVRRTRSLSLQVQDSATPQLTEGTSLQVSVDAGALPIPKSLKGKKLDVYVVSSKGDRHRLLMRHRGTEDWFMGTAS